MRRPWICLTLAIVTLASLGLLLGEAAAQIKQGKTRAAKTKRLMKGLVAANCGGLKETLDAKPADDEAWEKAAVQASLLNEGGYLLMDDGRCPDGDWKGACEALQKASAEVLTAVEAKDLDKATAAFANVTKACGQCHSKHKK